MPFVIFFFLFFFSVSTICLSFVLLSPTCFSSHIVWIIGDRYTRATEGANTKLKSNVTFGLLIPKWLLYTDVFALFKNKRFSCEAKMMYAHEDLCQVASVPFQIAKP